MQASGTEIHMPQEFVFLRSFRFFKAQRTTEQLDFHRLISGELQPFFTGLVGIECIFLQVGKLDFLCFEFRLKLGVLGEELCVSLVVV